MGIEPRLNLITLGVADMDRAIRFYRDGLGWPLSTASAENFALFKLSTGTALALHPRKMLAEDANIADPGGWGGITLAQNLATIEAVDQTIAAAIAAGATLLKAPQKAHWGGYSGYFVDPDGHPWEVAYNPFLPLVDGKFDVPV
jgi:catechol 2,3-dioxygenase-like lactoylglutathione lyase family enzyme